LKHWDFNKESKRRQYTNYVIRIVEHNARVQFISLNSFKVQFIWFNTFLENNLILRIIRSLSKNNFAINDISLSKFKNFDYIIFCTVNCGPSTSVCADHVIPMERRLIVKAIDWVSCSLSMAHSYCEPIVGGFEDLEWEFLWG
jgi:hypothetical protein